MFPSPLGSRSIGQTERSLKKRNNSTSSASSASRCSPYPPVPFPFNAFPEQESEVLKTFEDCYDCLQSNRGTINARPSLAIEDNQKSSIVSSSTVVDAKTTRTSRDDSANLSYIGMIATAILAMPEAKLTLAGIYRYMEGHFSTILRLRAGWRNTVRHNLSLHECFVKGEIATEGKGRFWRIHPNYFEQFKCGRFNKNVLRSALPVFYPTTANFHFSARPHMGASPTPSRASMSPMFPTSVSHMLPTSYPYMSPMSPTTSSPYQGVPFYQHGPSTTCLPNRREYCEFHMFPYQQCPPDFRNTCTHVHMYTPGAANTSMPQLRD